MKFDLVSSKLTFTLNKRLLRTTEYRIS